MKPGGGIAVLYAVLFLIQAPWMFLFSLPFRCRDAHLPRAGILQVGIAHHGFISCISFFCGRIIFFCTEVQYWSYPGKLCSVNVVKSDSISSIFHPSSVLRFYHSCLPNRRLQVTVTGINSCAHIFLIILAAVVIVSLSGHGPFLVIRIRV